MELLKKNSNKISKRSIGLFTRDYGRYLKENNNYNTRLIKEDYILFIDMGYPIPYDNFLVRKTCHFTREV